MKIQVLYDKSVPSYNHGENQCQILKFPPNKTKFSLDSVTSAAKVGFTQVWEGGKMKTFFDKNLYKSWCHFNPERPKLSWSPTQWPEHSPGVRRARPSNLTNQPSLASSTSALKVWCWMFEITTARKFDLTTPKWWCWHCMLFWSCLL